jgi:AraC-type transcriptional regulator
MHKGALRGTGGKSEDYKEQSPRVAELREELRRKIAAHAPNAGAHATAILCLTLYRRTAPSPCYPATYEPSLNLFVQGRKRISLAGATYLCDESTFLMSSVDVPVVSQIVAASEEVPLLSLLHKLGLSQSGCIRPNRSVEHQCSARFSAPARLYAVLLFIQTGGHASDRCAPRAKQGQDTPQ